MDTNKVKKRILRLLVKLYIFISQRAMHKGGENLNPDLLRLINGHLL